MKQELFFGKKTLRISVLTIITVLVWIGFDVYRALTKVTIPQVQESQMATLNPEIPLIPFDKLEKKFTFDQNELGQITPVLREEEALVSTKSAVIE